MLCTVRIRRSVRTHGDPLNKAQRSNGPCHHRTFASTYAVMSSLSASCRLIGCQRQPSLETSSVFVIFTTAAANNCRTVCTAVLWGALPVPSLTYHFPARPAQFIPRPYVTTRRGAIGADEPVVAGTPSKQATAIASNRPRQRIATHHRQHAGLHLLVPVVEVQAERLRNMDAQVPGPASNHARQSTP
jgi:hypothetical protein